MGWTQLQQERAKLESRAQARGTVGLMGGPDLERQRKAQYAADLDQQRLAKKVRCLRFTQRRQLCFVLVSL